MYKLFPFQYSYSKSGKAKKIFLEKSLELRRNETIAIVGASGSGKTTLLKVLKGIIPEFSSGVFEGEITFHDKKLTGMEFQNNLQKILYLFQNPFSQLIYPDPEEEFLFSMENFNYSKEAMNEQKEKFEKLFGLQAIWGKKNADLSNGECQKLVLASLLAINPEVILLDEPTAFLDPKARSEFYQFLNMIKGERLLVIVDHHVDEIKSLVTRVIEVEKSGRIVEKNDLNVQDSSLKHKINFDGIDLPINKQAELKLSGINFSYDKKRSLLKDVNLTAHSGEILAIKGKNGAGKSTLMKIISGVISTDSGEIKLNNSQRVYSDNKIFPHVGFIFQNPETHFFFDTIEEELKQSFKNLKSDQFKSELLSRFFHDIDLKKSPFLLSEGEKRRLTILMTIFLGKTLIIYDEPTFGQDKNSIQEISDLMKELSKTGIIQLCISHDDHFIKATAKRVLELKEGSLHEIP